MQLKIWHKMIIGIAIPSFIALMGGVLTFGYINDIKNRQHYVLIADDLKERVLELRRNEKNFLYIRNRESLDYLDDAIQTLKESTHQTSDMTDDALVEKDFSLIRDLISTYSGLVHGLFEHYQKEDSIVEDVRTEGRKLEDYVARIDQKANLTTSFILHLRLLEKNYMLFRDSNSYERLSEGLSRLKQLVPSCDACNPYHDAVYRLITTHASIDPLENRLQSIGGNFEKITERVAMRERERINAFLDKTKFLLIGALILLCTSGPFFVYKTATYIAAPIKRLVDITKRITDGDLTLRAPIREYDETYSLATSFNIMLDELQSTHQSLQNSMKLLREKQAQLIESEKRASLGLLVSGVAHELNNPLNNISLTAERIAEDGEYLRKEDLEGLHNIVMQCERAKNIVNDLLDFARARKSTEMEKLDIVMVIEDSFSLVGNQLKINNINLETDIPVSVLYVHGNRSKLEQVFVSIITNAIQAIESDGTITVRLRSQEKDRKVRISISDTGPGIAKDDLKNIFEPFFTTKPVGEGTGLGLSVCRSLIHEHNGEVEVESTPDIGSTFTIILPLCNE